MEEPIKAIGSVVALIAGLIALLKGALDLIKEYQTNQATLGTLFARRRFWLAAGLSMVGIAALIIAVWWATSRSKYVLTVQIWTVEGDVKGALLTSERFTGSAGKSLSDETLDQIGRRVTQQIAQKYNLNAETIAVQVHVPANLETGELDVRLTPPTAHKIYFWTTSKSGKGRALVEQQALARVQENFDLEINVPGYDVKTVRVIRGQALDSNLKLTPQPIAIGIEEFTGEKNSVSTWLSNYLATNSRFLIKDSNSLKALRDAIAQERERLASNPAMQMSIRTSLGLHVIISGQYERP